jgi:hypothetical protein
MPPIWTPKGASGSLAAEDLEGPRGRTVCEVEHRSDAVGGGVPERAAAIESRGSRVGPSEHRLMRLSDTSGVSTVGRRPPGCT